MVSPTRLFGGRVAAGLQPVHPGVLAVELHQFAVTSRFGDAAISEDVDAVGVGDGREPVADHDDGSAFTQALDGFEERRLCVPSQVAMVGDRLFTDTIVGNRLGLFTILVQPPENELALTPPRTSIFKARSSFLRNWEIWIARKSGVKI